MERNRRIRRLRYSRRLLPQGRDGDRSQGDQDRENRLRILLLLCSLAPLLLCSFAFAVAPKFHDGVFLFDGADTLDVGSYSAPYAYDWNGDGKKDLLVGQFVDGLIRFYPNVGTNYEPVFNGYELLTADGSIITLPYS
jgi:hypothetical protein